MPFQKGNTLRLGKHLSIESREKMRISLTGRKLTPEHREKVIKTLIINVSGSKSPKWKGENITYHRLHSWLVKTYGKATFCTNDRTHTGKYEWANISGTYKRDISDYKPLCIKCHGNMDNVAVKGWITRREGVKN